MSDILKRVGQNVMDYRKRQGMSILTLALQAGISLKTAYNIEQGKDIKVSTLEKVAKALGIEVRKLLE